MRSTYGKITYAYRAYTRWEENSVRVGLMAYTVTYGRTLLLNIRDM